MRRKTTTIIAFIISVLLANSGTGADPPEEGAQRGVESSATGTTIFVRLVDGSELEVESFRISSGYVLLTLPDGAQVAYAIGDVDRESLLRKPEKRAPVNIEEPPREIAMGIFGGPETDSLIDVEAPRRQSALTKYASGLKPIDLRSQPLIEGTYQDLPIQKVNPEGSNDQTEPSTDAASKYMESLIAREEEEHQEALLWYEDQIKVLADFRTELARAWNRASAACAGSTIVGAQGYGIVANSWESWRVDARVYGWIDNSTTPTCRAMMADAKAMANALVAGLNYMSGKARRNGILPGEARRILGSYGFKL